MKEPIIVCLGRYGDICNALPMAAEMAGKKPVKFVVAREFASILDGIGYVEPIVWDGPYSKPINALGWIKRQRIQGEPIMAQTHGYVYDRVRKTDSYQKEAWRMAGRLHKFGTVATIFDQRDLEREDILAKSLPQDKPWILCCFEGVSSPFKGGPEILKKLEEKFPDYHIIDLSKIRSERVYDMIGLLDRAFLTVSIDTLFLHLARTSNCPFVSIINNKWLGSVPPPTSLETIRYENSTPENVLAAVDRSISRLTAPRRVFHTVRVFGSTDRHKRAQESWKALQDVIPVHVHQTNRSSAGLGDKRTLAYLKDILWEGMVLASDEDLILWANDDVQIPPESISWMKKYVGAFGACTIRREEKDFIHCGRDMFIFTKKWLSDYWDEIPDYLLGEHQFDLGIAAMIRAKMGITSCFDNMRTDFFPCEGPQKFCIHESHVGDWTNGEYANSPAKHHNRELFSRWLHRYQPQIKFWK